MSSFTSLGKVGSAVCLNYTSLRSADLLWNVCGIFALSFEMLVCFLLCRRGGEAAALNVVAAVQKQISELTTEIVPFQAEGLADKVNTFALQVFLVT